MVDTATLCMGCMAVKGSAAICPQCGYEPELDRSPLVLPYRTVLNDKFLVGRVLGKPGGFGITCLAWDTTLETPVAIKEFLPGRTVSRDPGSSTVVPNSSDDKPVFEKGLAVFLNEARTLVKFNHSNIVRVREYFSQNNTAYFVMDYYDGVSLSDYVRRRGTGLDPKPAIAIMLPMLAGLEVVHRQGYLHRDIKPGNIYMTGHGNPILLDFGAARLVLGEETMSLSVVLTGGYAPYEQYHRKGRQGPWTDVYGFGATLYFMLTGQRPPDAIERSDDDQLDWPDEVNHATSPQLSFAVMKALELQIEDRPQSVAEFRSLLTENAATAPGRVTGVTDDYYEKTTDAASYDWATSTERGTQPTSVSSGRSVTGWIIAAAVLVAALSAYLWGKRDDDAQSTHTSRVAEISRPSADVVVPVPDPGTPDTAMSQSLGSDDRPAVGPGGTRAAVAQPPEFELPPPAPEQVGVPGPRADYQRGLPRGPPPHAIRACDGKASGAQREMDTPHGVLPRVCRQVPAAFACVPEFGRGPPPPR